MFASNEAYVSWTVWLLLAGGVLGLGAGGWLLYLSRGQSHYFRLRRTTLQRAWRLVALGAGFALAGGLCAGLGQPALEVVAPPTPTATASATPSATPTASQTPSRTPSPTASASPTLSPTPSRTPTPTLTPLPALPFDRLTPPAPASSVTPPPEALAANLRFARRANCTTAAPLEAFDPLPKTIYAHFDYDSWLPGVLWAGAWYRDGEPLYVETGLWDGSTGGCGYTSFDNRSLWWTPGSYEVQIFLGGRWLVSGSFRVLSGTPTPTP